MGRESASGSGIRDEQPGSYFLELRNHFFGFFGVKILKFFDADPESGWNKFRSGIRDEKNSDPGSRMGKIRIRDKFTGSAIPVLLLMNGLLFSVLGGTSWRCRGTRGGRESCSGCGTCFV
jgi:hypothetical protein